MLASIKEREVTPEQKVWLHVLLQAQEEAAGMHLYTKSRGETKQDVQRAAIEFLTEDSQDFRDVCSNAGYSREQCREILEKGKKKWLG